VRILTQVNAGCQSANRNVPKLGYFSLFHASRANTRPFAPVVARAKVRQRDDVVKEK
jgi:hypothetical protein